MVDVVFLYFADLNLLMVVLVVREYYLIDFVTRIT